MTEVTRKESARKATQLTFTTLVVLLLTIVFGAALWFLGTWVIEWLTHNVTADMVGWACLILVVPALWLFFYVGDRLDS